MSASPDDASARPPQGGDPVTQNFQYSQVSARVPEKVGRGVFCTGVLALQGPHEFVLDFVQGMVHPRQVAARVVLPPGVMASVVNALRENLNLYQKQFGPPPAVRAPAPPPTPPTIEEIYAQLKIADELFSGVYANAALISHTQAEVCIDFITNFYPKSAVSCRVYLAAMQLPGVLHTLGQSYQQYQQKLAGRPPEPPPPPA